MEYFIISTYLLIKHLHKHYVIDEQLKATIREYIYYFHERWKTYDESTDTDMLSFSNHRQQGKNDLEIRDRIMCQIFFEYLKENSIEIKTEMIIERPNTELVKKYLDLVNDVAKVNINGKKVFNFYSFATKYCSHHKPIDYPIYDSYVEKLFLMNNAG